MGESIPSAGFLDAIEAVQVGGEMLRDALDRNHDVDHAGRDGAVRHAGMTRARLIGALRQC